jgi:hypothetical protein
MFILRAIRNTQMHHIFVALSLTSSVSYHVVWNPNARYVLKQHTICPHPEPDKSNPLSPLSPPLRLILLLSPPRLGLQSLLIPSGFPAENL